MFIAFFQSEDRVRVKEEPQEWTEREVPDKREGNDHSHGDFVKVKEEKLEKIKIKRTHSPSEVKDREHRDHHLERASSLGSQEGRGSWRSPDDRSTKTHEERGDYQQNALLCH